jgi:radical SAM protein
MHGRDSWPFDEKPLLVFWETTKACMLACKHCRASAILKPLPGELSTDEGKKLIDDIAEFGKPSPILVFTGGDPLMRKDIWELVDYALSKGIRVALAPAVTELLEKSLDIIADKKLSVSISLDGSKPEIHDNIRGIKGHFQKTINILKLMIKKGIRVQVNTAVMRDNAEDLADIAKLLADIGIKTWEVFYLIPVGRAQKELDLTPQEWEDVSNFLFDVSKYGIVVRTTEGPMFRRIALMRLLLESMGIDYRKVMKLGPLYEKLERRLRELLGGPRTKPMVSTVGTRDGKGIIFVAYDGTVYPSGFMPYPLGNIRSKSLVEIYREHPVLRKIRAAEFKGRCGVCEFRDICGGSRARAYVLKADPLGEDPACPYEPGEFTKLVEKLGVDIKKYKSLIQGLELVLPLKPRQEG